MKKHQPRTIAKLEPVQQAALDAAYRLGGKPAASDYLAQIGVGACHCTTCDGLGVINAAKHLIGPCPCCFGYGWVEAAKKRRRR